jgi:hypothetical protein
MPNGSPRQSFVIPDPVQSLVWILVGKIVTFVFPITATHTPAVALSLAALTGVHSIAGRYEIAAPRKNLTLERFGRNSKSERQSNMIKIETPHNIV